jgi:FK506-binding protein 2
MPLVAIVAVVTTVIPVKALLHASHSTQSPPPLRYNNRDAELSQVADNASLLLPPTPPSPVIVSSRRMLLTRTTATTAAFWAATVAPHPPRANAAVTDATDLFADNDWSLSSKTTIPVTPSTRVTGSIAPTDEITILVSKRRLAQTPLGLELSDIEFRTNRRVYIKSVAAGSYAESLGLKTDWIVVAVNGQSVERTNAAGVRQYLAQAMNKNDNFSGSNLDPDAISITFRDPSIFRTRLEQMSRVDSDSTASDQAANIVTTQVAPAGDTTQRNPDGSVRAGRTVTTATADQRVTVQQLVPPRYCTRGAATDDLLELSYIGTVVETGDIFDGSAILIDGKGIPGRGNDVTTFFVLGRQPFGQFPPGWDVGLTGMCVGERRRLLLPPELGYGATGVPRRRIPPNATLQYDVTLVSLNGLATPQ